MSGAGAMTMRATVSRNTVTSSNDWGTPSAPTFEAVGGADVPCRAWSRSRREIRDDGKTAVVEDLRAIVPADANILEDDRLEVRDRRGTLIFDGPVAVETITKRGQSPSGSASSGHLELMLVRHAT